MIGKAIKESVGGADRVEAEAGAPGVRETGSAPSPTATGLSFRVGLVAVAYTAVIFLLHAIPTGANVDLNRVELASIRPTDLVHLAMFLPWALVGTFIVHRRPEGRLLRAAGWLLLGLAVAVAAEGVQYWLPYRSFNWSDMGFNVAGVLLGAPALLYRPTRRIAA